MELARATWTELEVGRESWLLVVPIGSTEQHGPHLPLGTDTVIAVELARRLAERRSDVVVAPSVPYGASGEHAAFPGTMVVRHEVLAELLVELVRSARDVFTGSVLVSGHGGNREALSLAEERCRGEGDAVLVWAPSARGGDAHAGRTETSLLLAIDHRAVRLDLAQAGCTEPLEVIMPRLRAEGVRPISSNGVLGDPAGASAEEGLALLLTMADDLADAVGRRWPRRVPGG
ncbi:MAG TPA: mycofactocin biosynthesis peptidyl-dipeptidase MftE [Acidimicrobiales bacterium]|nr:mycofactocin biosynthesis peptidyl-dipeptidase MftE [Acidimicrobiales bacterium]